MLERLAREGFEQFPRPVVAAAVAEAGAWFEDEGERAFGFDGGAGPDGFVAGLAPFEEVGVEPVVFVA